MSRTSPRAFIRSEKPEPDPAPRDEVVPLPLPQRDDRADAHPAAYGIASEPEAREYRVALTRLTDRR